MARVAERSRLTPAEFLAWEREQPIKHEFFHGEVFAMAGGSPRHNALCSGTNAALRNALLARGCAVLTSDQRVASIPGKHYVYPDISVVCGKAVFQDDARDVLLNPSVIVEVLSKSTADYDRGLKWQGYQAMASLTDYLLVSQSAVLVEHFRRNTDGTWTYRAAGVGERIVLDNGAEIAVDAVYAGVFELPGDDEVAA
jgi:Uma2 family endonuclease